LLGVSFEKQIYRLALVFLPRNNKACICAKQMTTFNTKNELKMTILLFLFHITMQTKTDNHLLFQPISI
jgi:hypothetical protein